MSILSKIFNMTTEEPKEFANPLKPLEDAHRDIMSDLIKLDRMHVRIARQLDGEIRKVDDDEAKAHVIATTLESGLKQYTEMADTIIHKIDAAVNAAKQSPAGFCQQTVDSYCSTLSDWKTGIAAATNDLTFSICQNSVFYHVRRELFSDLVNEWPTDRAIVRGVIC